MLQLHLQVLISAPSFQHLSRDVGKKRKRTAQAAGLDSPEEDSDPDEPKRPRRGGTNTLPESSFNVSNVQEEEVVAEDGAGAAGEVAAEVAETVNGQEETYHVLQNAEVEEDGGDGGDLRQ
jgi:hypothetical protein